MLPLSPISDHSGTRRRTYLAGALGPAWHPRVHHSPAHFVITNILVFAVAAFFEIAGCFAFWMWLRRGASIPVAVLGIASLVAFAVTLTRVDSAFAGRAYAAYGGIYIAASLMWLWLAEGQRPRSTDLIGAGIAIVGALIIIAFAAKNAGP